MEGVEVAEHEERQGGRAGGLLGELGAAAGIPLSSTSTAPEVFRVVKSGAGTLYGFTASNLAGVAAFVQVFDLQGVLAANAVPAFPLFIAGNTSITYSPGVYGRPFLQGLILALSTTAAAFVAGGANGWFDAQYA